MKKRLFLGLLTIFCASALALPSQNQQLEQENVHQVMQQLFDQHLKSHEVNTKIIRESLKNYIDQFDPHRIYLLEKEVAPFLNLSDQQAKQILKQYENQNFNAYAELNKVIQHAIKRARDYRFALDKDKAALFRGKGDVQEEYSHFAKTPKELKQRIRGNILGYVELYKKRFGESYVMKYPTLILDQYQNRMQSNENQYLFVDQKDDVFVLLILKALAKSLDQYTEVLSPEEAMDMKIRLEKGFPGVGILLQQRPGKGTFITRLVEQGPAWRSGDLKPNDRVVSINGKPIDNQPFHDVVMLLRGKRGSAVHLVVERKVREGHRYVDKRYPVKLVREIIPVNEGRVEYSFDPIANGIIGKVELKSFYRGPNGITSTNDMKKAIKELNEHGNLRGLILDLRENSGGFLTEAVRTAGLFISNGVIVTAKYADGRERIFRDVDSTKVFDGPIIVLTSKATASAAEIVAQSLQDYGVAIVVGDETTYGKGTIQNQTVTTDPGSSYFKVTVGKYYTVSGKTPDQVGVKADIVLPSHLTHLDFGNEVIEYTSNEHATIPQAYKDKLNGVSGNLRGWFLSYYVPTLQEKETHWKQMLPILAKNSAHRLEKNKDYKLFLRQSGLAAIEEEEEVDEDVDSELDKNYGIADLQMAEAVNIVQDMIFLEQNMHDVQITSNEAVKK